MADDENFIIERRELIKRGEGCITHMYLDTVGRVTVGVGNMLSNADAAAELPFINRETGENATEEEIKAEFYLVAAQAPAKLAASYKQFTRFDLSPAAIDELLDRRIEEFEASLEQDFANYDNFPPAAKLGLMDMVFNLGNSGLINKFPSFTSSAREENWAGCAVECNRKGVADSRNQEVKDLFNSVA